MKLIYGYFDDKEMQGIHDRLGVLRRELKIIKIKDKIIGLERYFFDIDETNGIGIDKHNVLSYFLRS